MEAVDMDSTCPPCSLAWDLMDPCQHGSMYSINMDMESMHMAHVYRLHGPCYIATWPMSLSYMDHVEKAHGPCLKSTWTIARLTWSMSLSYMVHVL